MNPNKVNHFAYAGTGVDKKRSKFIRPASCKTTIGAGKLYPLYIDEVLPGDNMKLDTSALCRMLTPIVPVADNSYLDLYCFYVPNRLIWEHFEAFMGENDVDYWTESTVYEIPQIVINLDDRNYIDDNNNSFDLLSYLGVPVPSYDSGAWSVSHLPVRAYAKIWNDWFRDENLQTPAYINYGDSDTVYNPSATTYIDGINTGRILAPVNKFKDYFTTCLPAPQKGESVSLPFSGMIPVGSFVDTHTAGDYGIKWRSANPDAVNPFGGHGVFISADPNGEGVGDETHVTGELSGVPVYPSNLYADLSSADNVTATVNQLRLAIQSQVYLETLARSGSRYIESLYSLYGVKSSDARLQRSEFLGGKRVPINMTSVAQTSASVTGQTPQGNLSAYSLTGESALLADHFFEEHGFLMIVACIRTDNTYFQGIERLWSRKNRFDFYAPPFANLGEQPVLMKEIFYENPASADDVFGYQEAWAEYRYKQNKLTGGFLPGLDAGFFEHWTYAEEFANAPTLNSAFIQQANGVVSRTLAVNDNEHNQFLIDLYVNNESVRVMPTYSIPGQLLG